ncbi:hypothetical protein KCP77_16040 [Salmonella enterica subsp. enterica]|nr:hypothetical protein KCP77_16040 [Salmonella enterica subsp. enterica]
MSVPDRRSDKPRHCPRDYAYRRDAPSFYRVREAVALQSFWQGLLVGLPRHRRRCICWKKCSP